MTRLAFLHIPKTGGRTLIALCRAFYSDTECKEVQIYNPDKLRAYRFVYGHFNYVPELRQRLTFTILREPAARIASYYQMCLRYTRKQWQGYDLFWQRGVPMSILDFARDEILQSGLLHNGMVRQLTGQLYQDVALSGRDVDTAYHNLQGLLVGFQGEYECFVRRLCQRLNWPAVAYETLNQSAPYEIAPGILEEIRHINTWDCLLYKRAKENLNGKRVSVYQGRF